MPLIRVEMWEGRNPDLKRKLVKELTKVIVGILGCHEQAVTVVINDIPKHNWGIGGELASDRFKE
mgnify:CR=1 FL=1